MSGSNGVRELSQILGMHGLLGKTLSSCPFHELQRNTEVILLLFRRRFEDAHGTDDQLREVEKQCYNAEPRHGERWTMLSKDISNWRYVVI